MFLSCQIDLQISEVELSDC